MNRTKWMMAMVAGLMVMGFGNGCALFQGTMTQGDVLLLANDLRDVAHIGTVYALAEKPEWRANITLVRDQLNAVANEPNLSFDSLLTIMQGLPVDELKSNEAILAITAGKIILRRVGRNIDLGGVKNLSPLAKGLSQGITDGLGVVLP